MQAKLDEAGYYCGDDDVLDSYFGPGTQSALLTLQACEGLAETGIADATTWSKLSPTQSSPLPNPTAETTLPNPPSVTPIAPAVVPARPTTPAQKLTGVEGQDYFTKWPLLLESDGGKAVHALQVRPLVSDCTSPVILFSKSK